MDKTPFPKVNRPFQQLAEKTHYLVQWFRTLKCNTNTALFSLLTAPCQLSLSMSSFFQGWKKIKPPFCLSLTYITSKKLGCVCAAKNSHREQVHWSPVEECKELPTNSRTFLENDHSVLLASLGFLRKNSGQQKHLVLHFTASARITLTSHSPTRVPENLMCTK